MKVFRVCGAFLCAVLAVGAAQGSSSNKFDINNDGKVDGRDAGSLITIVGSGGANGSTPALPGSIHDLNGDGLHSRADWLEFVSYVTNVGAYPDALFDVYITSNQPLGVTASDKVWIAMAVLQGRGGSYSMRYDFNADGAVDFKDWMIFVSHYKKAAPGLLLDADGNGAVNGKDLDRYAQMIDTSSYDPALDLNGDGLLNVEDWKAVIQLANAVSPRSIFDVNEDQPSSSQPVLNGADSRKIAVSLNGMGIGFPVSIRYDLNGDGVIRGSDWTEWVRYITMVYKRPDFLYDINGDGVVNSGDQSMLNANIGVNPVQYQYDLNGDGVVNSRDAKIIKARLDYGPVQLLVGDVNRDGCVNAVDQALVQAAQGAMIGSAVFDADLDIISNGYIGPEDSQALTPNIGQCR